MLAALAPHFHRAWFTTCSTSQRAANAGALSASWVGCGGGTCDVAGTPAQALEAGRHWAGPDGSICVLGSVFLAGEIRSASDPGGRPG
jgi:folylpolyglutamate synthase/dihydropteroate synthase